VAVKLSKHVGADFKVVNSEKGSTIQCASCAPISRVHDLHNMCYYAHISTNCHGLVGAYILEAHREFNFMCILFSDLGSYITSKNHARSPCLTKNLFLA